MNALEYFTPLQREVLVTLLEAARKGRRLTSGDLARRLRIRNAGPSLGALKRLGVAHRDVYDEWFLDPGALALLELGAFLGVGIAALERLRGHRGAHV